MQLSGKQVIWSKLGSCILLIKELEIHACTFPRAKMLGTNLLPNFEENAILCLILWFYKIIRHEIAI